MEVARALLARATTGEPVADGAFLRAPVLLDAEAVGSVVTRPADEYAATTIENQTSRQPFETVSGAVAQVVQAYDDWVATGEERHARAREFGFDQMSAVPEGELPENATPVPDRPGYHQVSVFPGTVVYGPGNRRIGSVESRTYNQGKHKTLYGNDRPIRGENTIESSVRHLVEVHAELNDVPNRNSLLNNLPARDVWIEHHRNHTNVWNASDREHRFALEVAGGPRGFNPRNQDMARLQHGRYLHAMPKNLTYETRTEKVNALVALMAARGLEIPVFESLEAKQAAAAQGTTAPMETAIERAPEAVQTPIGEPEPSQDAAPEEPTAAEPTASVARPHAAPAEDGTAPAETPVPVLTELATVLVADREAGQHWEESNPRPSQRLAVFRDADLRTNVIVTGTEPGRVTPSCGSGSRASTSATREKDAGSQTRVGGATIRRRQSSRAAWRRPL